MQAHYEALTVKAFIFISLQINYLIVKLNKNIKNKETFHLSCSSCLLRHASQIN